MDMSQYLGVFIDEAREHLQNLNDKMTDLGQNQSDPDLINSIFRSAHTLKGSSGQMGFQNMMELTHKMENVLDALRQGQMTVDSAVIDLLFDTIDNIESMIDAIEDGGDDSRDVTVLINKLQSIAGGGNGKRAAVSAQPEQSVKSSPGSENEQESLVLNDYEQAVIDQALGSGLNVFGLTVTLRADCLLKAARATMVFRNLENIGTILKANPPVDDIEKEAFDRCFYIILATDTDEETVQDAALNVSEIENVAINSVSLKISQGEKPEKVHAEQPASAEVHQKSAGTDSKTPKQKKTVSKTIRVSLNRLDRLMNLFEELILDRGRLEKAASSLDSQELNDAMGSLSRVSDQLQETILNLRMEPVEQVFNRFPRMIRKLSKELDKKVKLVISGAETELDRAVIDEIGDPMMHMIRNSMDHGIEHPDVREKMGKPREGTLVLRAYHSGNHVFIEIEDDGAGINREKVLSKAIQKKLIRPEEADQLTDNAVYHLLFASGFSTADKISDISGRGVGLDVVEKKIRSLNGTVHVESNPGRGTMFIIKLPLTLSIINAMLVQCGDEVYALPISSIAETALLRQVQMHTIHQQQVMTFRDQVVPVVDLHHYLQIPEASGHDDSHLQEKGSESVILAKHGNQTIGILVDRLIGYQEIVIKPLGNYLKGIRGFSGATILGDGHVVLILDCQTVIEDQKTTRKQLKA